MSSNGDESHQKTINAPCNEKPQTSNNLRVKQKPQNCSEQMKTQPSLFGRYKKRPVQAAKKTPQTRMPDIPFAKKTTLEPVQKTQTRRPAETRSRAKTLAPAESRPKKEVKEGTNKKSPAKQISQIQWKAPKQTKDFQTRTGTKLGVAFRAHTLQRSAARARNESLTKKTPVKKTGRRAWKEFENWKKKNNISPEKKVFVVSNGMIDIKEALLKRGWVENPNQNSNLFDFKWAIKTKDVINEQFEDFQMVNHFCKNSMLTTKSGLAKSLINVNTFHDIDHQSFFPRCYNLEEPEENEDFQFEYRFSVGMAFVRKLLKTCELKDLEAISSALEQSEVASELARGTISLLIISKRGLDIDDIIDETSVEFDPNVLEEEWELLNHETKTQLSSEEALNLATKFAPIYKASAGEDIFQRVTSGLRIFKNGMAAKEFLAFLAKQKAFLEVAIKGLIEKINQKDIQLGSYGENHLWILKPGTSSRGRGIEVFSSLQKILDKRASNRDVPWVVQKYLENSLLVKGRKFDIRQWVLVTDWNPLTVWFYEDCYLRFAGQTYCPESFNPYIHLTNYSISKTLQKDFDGEDQNFFEENMWSSQRLSEWLIETTGQDIYNEKILPKLKEIVIWTMSSGQDLVDQRKNSMELFGFDMMVDDQYETYLIEVNSSPSMTHSTPVTATLVKNVAEDFMKVIIDNNNGRKRPLGDTGRFSCIWRSKAAIQKPTFYLNFNLSANGQKITNLQAI